MGVPASSLVLGRVEAGEWRESIRTFMPDPTRSPRSPAAASPASARTPTLDASPSPLLSLSSAVAYEIGGGSDGQAVLITQYM